MVVVGCCGSDKATPTHKADRKAWLCFFILCLSSACLRCHEGTSASLLLAEADIAPVNTSYRTHARQGVWRETKKSQKQKKQESYPLLPQIRPDHLGQSEWA